MAKDKNAPIVMAEEYWANSYFSIVRRTGEVNFRGHHYVVVNKEGIDVFELSRIAIEQGRANEKIIPPGEPCDLVRADMIPTYRALGRERFLALLDKDLTDEEIRAAGIAGKKRSRAKSARNDKK